MTRRYVILGGPRGELSAREAGAAFGPYCITRDGRRYSIVPPADYTRDWLPLATVNIPRRLMAEMRDPLARVQVLRSGYASLLRTFAAGTY